MVVVVGLSVKVTTIYITRCQIIIFDFILRILLFLHRQRYQKPLMNHKLDNDTDYKASAFLHAKNYV